MNAQRCVLFADVSGSTRLYEKLGDAEALRAVDACLNTLRRVIAVNGGQVIKTIGDEIMATFASAEVGMQAASEMQQRIFDMPAVSGVKLGIRLGFHHGSVVEENGDVFGDTVNTAARMAGLAKSGQIITTAATVEALPALLRQSTRDLDALTVKGKSEDIKVFEVIWQEDAELTMKADRPAQAPVAAAKLKLRYKDSEVLLDAASGPLLVGRDSGCDLAIRDPRASRQHARIERRRDKFVLVDQSTNGTYLKTDGEAEVTLKHEEMPLRGRGLIGLGHCIAEAGVEAIEFSVQG